MRALLPWLLVASVGAGGAHAMTDVQQSLTLGGIVGTLFGYALVGAYVLACVRRGRGVRVYAEE